jgi:hypothetical protein
MADTTDPGAELAPILTPLPAAHDLGRALQEGVNETIARMRNERGPVTAAEDTFDTVRWIQGITERLTDYGRAFAGAAKLAESYAEEELIEAVGEQDGIPMANLTVPDPEGDLRLSKYAPNEHVFDLETLKAVTAAEAIRCSRGGEPVQDEVESDAAYLDRYEEWMADVIMNAMGDLLALGAFTPAVTKVRAFAKEVARSGDDKLAAAASGAVTSTSRYQRVKIERIKPKD